MSTRVFISRDSGALCVGADQVARALYKAFEKRGLDVEVVRTGSRGMYWLEPTIEVERPEGRIALGNLATLQFQAYAPLAEREYLNLTLAPDRGKVAFEVKGGNLFVMNIDGSGLVDLGPATTLNAQAIGPDATVVGRGSGTTTTRTGRPDATGARRRCRELPRDGRHQQPPARATADRRAGGSSLGPRSPQ